MGEAAARFARLAGRGILAMAMLTGLSLTVAAQETQPAQQSGTTAVGTPAAWSADVSAAGGAQAGAPLDEKQVALVKRINAYFNGIDDLYGRFLQTDPQAQQQKGEFYIKRPGKFRFVYAPPSKLVIMSDGTMLSFEDYELKHADRYPLESTPFRILLAKEVDILRDATVLDLHEAEDLVTLTMQDKAPDNPGQIRLFLGKNGSELELREWVITSPQGGDTRVEVADLVRDKAADEALFKAAPLELEAIKKKN